MLTVMYIMFFIAWTLNAKQICLPACLYVCLSVCLNLQRRKLYYLFQLILKDEGEVESKTTEGQKRVSEEHLTTKPFDVESRQTHIHSNA